MVPAAKIKLAATDNDAKKPIKKEICALLMACYATVAEESKHIKPTLVAMLPENIAANQERVAIGSFDRETNHNPHFQDNARPQSSS